MKNTKFFAIVLGLLMMIAIVGSLVSAVEVDSRTNQTYNRTATEDAINQGNYPTMSVISVKVNGDVVENGDEIRYDENRNQDLVIKVEGMATGNMSNVEIMAMINGDDHYDIVDASKIFDVEDGVIYRKSLVLSLPQIMEQDNY